MYKVKTNNKASKKIINKVDFVNLDGFLMPSKKQYFIINSERIKDIKVVDNELIKAMVSKKVKAKYKRLIDGFRQRNFNCQNNRIIFR